VLIGGILLGLILGLRSGGRLGNLASIQLRWIGLLFAAVIVRFGTEILLGLEIDLIEALRLPLFTAGFAMLLVALWANRGYPGLAIAFVGILLNGIAIIWNGGYMPIWGPSLDAAGLDPSDVTSPLHVVIDEATLEEFLTSLLFLSDIIPIPLPFIRNVASLGDVFLTVGLAFFLFAGTVRVPTLLEEAEYDAIKRRLAGLAGSTRMSRPDGSGGVAAETGLAPALRETAALERATFMGGGSGGLASPALAPLPAGILEAGDASMASATTSATTGTAALPLPRIPPETRARLRRHPYARLALNGSFSSLWAGQLISLFGDRIHQVALAAAVLLTTGSELASALVFVAAFVPNLIFSPIAGTFVDRWDNKEVLIVSDLLRAAVVLLIPMAIVTNVLLVYPFVFVMTTISIFFRPARVAILPRIVREDELVTANSSLWVGETLADVIGYPLAGFFVIVIGAALPVAFWLDAATYVASAVLLTGIIVARPGALTDESGADVDGVAGEEAVDADATEVAIDTGVGQGFFAEMRAGYRFLRSQPTLFANTIQASVAQLTVGVLTALMPAFSREVFESGTLGWEAVYGLIESSTGIGNLLGGFAIGLVGARLAKGRMISGGYLLWGLLTTVFALSGNLGMVLGLALGSGIANMAFIIPSQALFQELTPAALMGRVVGFRFALVFGAMAIAMAVGGLLTLVLDVTTVIALFGLVSAGAGIAGFLVPAIRDA
jgi:DHA3 family macrolide efflux protein-like MFS transporter